MNPIVKLIANALPGEKSYVLFVGAGVSKDANIPTSWDLMLKTAGLLYLAENPGKKINSNINLEKWLMDSVYAEMGFSEIMELIYSKNLEQQNFLNKYLNKYDIGESHKGIAELARRGIIRTIITTNFDHYIEKAIENLSFDIQVISSDDDLKNVEPLIQCKSLRIYKVHGNLGCGKLRNTPKDLESLSPLMEQEIIRVLSEHGVIVLGYSGRDIGIKKVFEKRKNNYYPVYWVDPNKPNGLMKEIFKKYNYMYIQCTGAGAFIKEFLRLSREMDKLAPIIGSAPTTVDLENCLKNTKSVGPVYIDFLDSIYKELEGIRPDFSKYKDIDEAILSQINNSESIIYRYVESVLLASRYKNLDALENIYGYFGNLYKLCNIPEGFSGSYYESHFDGYRFIIYEMFVSLIAALIKYENWHIIGNILSNDIFVEQKESKYISYSRINMSVQSLDISRNNRLHLERASITADLYKNRFTQGNLSQLISHRRFLEADYFLFMRSICNDQDKLGIWCPRSCVYLNYVPRFIVKAESRTYLENLVKAAGLDDIKEFAEKFRENNHLINKCFRHCIFYSNPVEDYNLQKIGTRN